jgi:hypothetical protein
MPMLGSPPAAGPFLDLLDETSAFSGLTHLADGLRVGAHAPGELSHHQLLEHPDQLEEVLLLLAGSLTIELPTADSARHPPSPSIAFSPHGARLGSLVSDCGATCLRN